ncbi:MAG: LPS assembly lipoprotein LptE [Gemmatimonadales bacterium]|nr:LPS assembly lipoprotein LptE [Gemmatimonadales bacterium]
MRRREWLAASAAAWAGSACYGFAGGGLPPEVRTVAILPFDNQTPEPALTQEINLAVKEAVQNRLGLLPAGEEQAHALVRGQIVRYEPDLPVAFQGGQSQQQVNVTRRLVQISVNVEITDQKRNRPLFQRSGLLCQGDYEPGREVEGRRRALQFLTNQIVEGAQSQW